MRSGFASLLLLLVSLCGMAPAGAQTLRAELLLTETELDGPPASAPVVTRVVAASPTERVEVPIKRRSTGYWLRLTTDQTIPAGTGRLLVLRGARAMGPVTFYPPAAEPRVINDAEHGGPALLRRGWTLPLPNGWPAASVAYLRVGAGTAEPLQLQFSDVSEIARVQRADARLTASASTAMLLMALVMLSIWLVFRDLLYLSYGAFLICVALYVLLQSGDAIEMWGLSNLAAYGLTGKWAVATLATILQLEFSVRFLELPRCLPRAVPVVRAVQFANLGLLALLLVFGERVHNWYYIVGNVLLLISIPLMLTLAVLAWRKGSAYAGYYLLGWTPLLLMAALVAANPLGLLGVTGADNGLALAAIMTSAVLALALSQHAANRHRIALLAEQSLERDPLTGALNAQALEQMLEGWHQLGGLGARHYAVLLLDLDNFGEVNAQHGRVIGDALLQQALARIRSVLRPDDTIARFGGDSFAVVSECTRDDAEQMARRLAGSLAQRRFRVDGNDIAVSASFGLAMSHRGETVAALLARATRALDEARSMGANRVSVAA